MNEAAFIGVDLANYEFQLHGAAAAKVSTVHCRIGHGQLTWKCAQSRTNGRGKCRA